MAVSIDGPETRPRIPDYLEKNHLRFRPFVARREDLPFDISFVGSLFVLDRKGKVAGVPSEFFHGDYRETARRRVSDLVEGKPAPGPLLVSLDRHPEGFGILWSQPLTTTVQAIGIAPAAAGPAEIGILDGEKLRRFSGDGRLVDQVSLDSPVRRAEILRGVDLDADGRNEWIAVDRSALAYGNLQILSPDGERIDGYFGRGLDFGGVADLDGDGVQDIVLRSGGEILAKRTWPGLLWRTGPLDGLKSLQADPGGGFLVQLGGKVRSLDQAGHLSPPLFRSPADRVLAGCLRLGPDTPADLFGSVQPENLDFRHDLDGDGIPEILIAVPGGVVGYGTDGSLELVVRMEEELMGPHFAAGDFDARPGDELVVAIPHFGLVALGRTAGVAPPGAGR